MALDPISTLLEMSSRFQFGDAPEGDRAREVVSWLANPNVDYKLTPVVLAKMTRYLLTGQQTLTAQEFAHPPRM